MVGNRCVPTTLILLFFTVILWIVPSSPAHALYNPGYLYRQSSNTDKRSPTQDPRDFNQYSNIPILMYHEIGEPFSQLKELFVKTEDFERQMQYLIDNGYNTVHMSDVANHWLRDGYLPPKPIVVTFDDGYRGNHSEAFPIMKQKDLTATIYIVENSLGNANFLTDDMIIEMHAAGFEIGHHTTSHVDLTTVTEKRLIDEVYSSKKRLENRLNIEMTTFAYPASSYDDRVIEQLQQAGFVTAVTTNYGLASWEQDLLQLKRIPVYRSFGLSGFRVRLQNYEKQFQN